MSRAGKVLYMIVCAAGPAAEVGRLVATAQAEGWTVQVVAPRPRWTSSTSPGWRL
ncbi:hypothetical protein [Streptosporangium roseum]|uniref:hypothetical protein n=1 Tax=Streptosporangium roseum TaxID=2001 RepID=UPI001C54E337|nr:hypothetical protein [Streptosporangium roseum]